MKRISTCAFLFVLLMAPSALGQEPSGPRPELYFTWAYVVGALAAMSWKVTIGVYKKMPTRRFKWKKLLVPTGTAVIVSIPLVFLVMPHFGRPTGNVMGDMIYAYLTTYTLVDMTADVFTVINLLRAHFSEPGDPEPPADAPTS